MPLNLTAYHKHLKTTHKPGEDRERSGPRSFLSQFLPHLSASPDSEVKVSFAKKECRHAALRSGCWELSPPREESHTAELGTDNRTRKRGWVAVRCTPQLRERPPTQRFCPGFLGELRLKGRRRKGILRTWVADSRHYLAPR